MSTFLELCGDVARESGGVATAPASVESQTGRQNKTVQWVAAAWEAIQRANRDWLFLRTEFEGALVAGVNRYTGASLGLTDHASWILDYSGRTSYSIHTVGDQTDESRLRWIPYEVWRRVYDFGSHDSVRPTRYSVSWANELVVGATPDDAYTLRGEYIRTPQVLSANADVPLMPERFHQAIVWKAIMLMSQHDSAWDAYNAAELRYDEVRRDMERELLPEITIRTSSIDR